MFLPTDDTSLPGETNLFRQMSALKKRNLTATPTRVTYELFQRKKTSLAGRMLASDLNCCIYCPVLN